MFQGCSACYQNIRTDADKWASRLEEYLKKMEMSSMI